MEQLSPLPYMPLCLNKHSDKFTFTHPTEQNMCPSVQPKCYFLITLNSSSELLYCSVTKLRSFSTITVNILIQELTNGKLHETV